MTTILIILSILAYLFVGYCVAALLERVMGRGNCPPIPGLVIEREAYSD